MVNIKYFFNDYFEIFVKNFILIELFRHLKERCCLFFSVSNFPRKRPLTGRRA